MGLLAAILPGLFLYVVVFIPLNAAAHKDVFGCWPQTWLRWLFVWIDTPPPSDRT